MKKKILIIVYIMIMIVCAKQALNYFYNDYVMDHYRDGDYSINDNLLLSANFIEPYIAHYNNGNIFYNNSLYEEAINEYREALKCTPIPEKRECSIRINLALAMLKTLGDDYSEPENIDDSLALLYEARDVLLEVGCASDDGDGHSWKAQKLKDDIDEMIEELEDIKDQEQETEPSDSSEASDGSGESSESGETGSSGGNTMPDPSDPVNPTTDPSETSDGGSDPSETSEPSETTEIWGSRPTETTTIEQFDENTMEQMQQAAQEAYLQRQQELEDYAEYDNYNYDYNGIW